MCYSTLVDPGPAAAEVLPEHSLRLGSRAADFVQLAHYHRMLQACGFAATPARGAVIGNDPRWPNPVLAWADLDRPLVRTFSRSHPDGWRLRSVLERYDFEQAFRISIAEVARRQTGDPATSPPPLVRPIVNAECGRCHWWEHCRPQLNPEDVSLRIDKGALDSREIVTLRRHGIATITDLAGVELDELLTWYLPEVTHRSGAELRIRTAARRARMLLEGRWFDRESSGPIEVPAADVEIDFDIETAVDGRVYLWGFGVQAAGGPGVYHEFSRFTDLDDVGELELAREAFEWLRSVLEAGERVLVFHYSGYEVAKIRALADRAGDPLLDWAAGYAEEQFVDLLEIVKNHYFGAAGLGTEADGPARRILLAGLRSGWAQLPGLVRRGGPRRDSDRTDRRSATGAGLQRGRRARHRPPQSVAASPVIAASKVRRWDRSMTASTSSTPWGGEASAALSPAAFRTC